MTHPNKLEPESTRWKIYRDKGSRGFTLIELLVVVGTIALLLVLLLPALGRAKEQAKLTTCLSNVRTASTAALLYAQEWEGAFMPYESSYTDSSYNTWSTFWYCGVMPGAGATGKGNTSIGLLTPYILSAKGCVCPSAPFEMTAFDAQDTVKLPLPVSAYDFYDNIYNNRVSKFTAPANTVMIAESGNITYGGSKPPVINSIMEMLDTASCLPASPSGLVGVPNFLARHNKKGAVGWVDGHATAEPAYFLNPTDITAVSSPAAQQYITQLPLGLLTPVPQSVALTDLESRIDRNAYFSISGWTNVGLPSN